MNELKTKEIQELKKDEIQETDGNAYPEYREEIKIKAKDLVFIGMD